MLSLDSSTVSRALGICFAAFATCVAGCSDNPSLSDADSATPGRDASTPGADAPGKPGNCTGDASASSTRPGAVIADDAGSGDAADATISDSDGDVDCTCTINDAGRAYKSLACHCATYPGKCEQVYERTLAACRTSAANSLDFYDTCNLIVMTFAPSWYPGGGTVFDATTHEIVGISVGTDTAAYTCGDAHVYGYDAGRFPGPECQVTRRWPGCSESDGGRSDACAAVGTSM